MNTKKMLFATGMLCFGLALTLVVMNENDTQPAQAYYQCTSQKCKEAEAAEAAARASAAKAAEAADSYQAKVNQLGAQVNQLQAEINAQQAIADELQAKITENELKLDKQQQVLADMLVDMHFTGRVEPISILAGSKSISDYAEKQSRQVTVKEQIDKSAKSIKEIKLDLEMQKFEVDNIISDQKTRRNTLNDMKAEQQEFVDKYRENEAAYMADAKEAERIKNAAREWIQEQLGGGGGINCGGGYAYCYNGVDPWGLYNKQCVSYTAWKVATTYGNMPRFGGSQGYKTTFWAGSPFYIPDGGWVSGHALYWLDQAAHRGIPYGNIPKAGSVGIMGPSAYNPYGHAVWIESVSGNTVYYSDYNRAGVEQYGEGAASASTFTYIYFGEWR